MAPGTCDTLIVTLRLKNESMLGNYYNVMRFMINGEVNYDYGFMIDVPVRENFDIGARKKKHKPLISWWTRRNVILEHFGKERRPR